MLPGKEDRMNYQELWNEENTQITERYDLASDRIQEIPGENRIPEPFRSYFTEMSRFAGQIEELARRQLRDELESLSLEELKELNDSLYRDILPEHYGEATATRSMRQKSWEKTGGLFCLHFMRSLEVRLCLPMNAG